MKFFIDHNTKQVRVSCRVSLEILHQAKIAATNHGYDLITVF